MYIQSPILHRSSKFCCLQLENLPVSEYIIEYEVEKVEYEFERFGYA
jgi:hypothetical protein